MVIVAAGTAAPIFSLPGRAPMAAAAWPALPTGVWDIGAGDFGA